MRLLSLTLLTVVIALALAKKAGRRKSSMLLGADDVDMKAAEIGSKDDKAEADAAPQTLKDVKKLTREDKMAIKQLHNQLKVLKEAMKDVNKSKSEKKKLKKQFRELKSEVHSKRTEFNHLKSRKNELKHQKAEGKKQPGKKGGKGNKKKGGNVIVDQTTVEATTATTANTTTTAPPTTTTPKELESFTARLSKADRKALRGNKKNRNKNKKNKNKESLDMLMQADAPAVSAVKPTHRGSKRKQSCVSDSDCKAAGRCIVNHKGNKVCRGGNRDKAAGKKCHASEQCARGLKCFVVQTAEMKTHKKHKRRGKGICADPVTADVSKGSFIPYKTTL